MTDEHPVVLWIDEDQGIFQAVVYLIARKGWRLHRAPSVRDGLKALETVDPDAIILDTIVAKGMKALEQHSFYPGLTVWRKLTANQQERTVVLSIVPFGRLDAYIHPHEKIPRERFFWKPELQGKLDLLQNALEQCIKLRSRGSGNTERIGN